MTGARTTIVDGNANDRILQVFAPATLTLSGMTLRNGDAVHGGGSTEKGGGAIANESVVFLSDVTLSGNNAEAGGALKNFALSG